MPSLLSRVGKGLISFGTGIPAAEIDNIRAGRDINQANARIAEVQATEAEQLPQQREAEAARQQEIQSLIGVAMSPDNPDRDKALTRIFQVDPDLANQVFDGIGARSQAQREDAARRAAEIQSTPPEARAEIINRQAQDMIANDRNPKDTLSLLEMSPEEQDNILRFTQAAALSAKDRAEQANQAEQTSQENRRLAQADERIDIQRETLEADQEANRIAESLKANERLNEGVRENLKTEEGLRKEVNTLLKDFIQVSDSFARVQAAGSEPTAAGDLALIFNYMKMLDPGSTIREGEFATAENSGSVGSRLIAQFNKLKEGERLSPKQRGDFIDRAGKLYRSQLGEAQKTATAYEGIASSAGVNVDNVLANFNVRRDAAEEIETPEPNTTSAVQVDSELLEFMTPEQRALFQ